MRSTSRAIDPAAVSIRVSLKELLAFVTALFESTGLPSEQSSLTADVLVTSESWGIHTHGVKLARAYCRRLRAGGLNTRAMPQIVRSGPAWAIIDGQSGVGTVTSAFAMKTAVSIANVAGFAYVGVKNSCHFGAAAFYAHLASLDGMIGIAMANDTPSVTGPGAKGPVIGSNPIAYSIPFRPGRPILFDIATSTVAGGKVFAALESGQDVPLGWLTDELGLPTADPRQLLHGGALTSLGGHKGFGIATLIECLSAVVTGADVMSHVMSFSLSPPQLSTGHGGAFLALNIKALAPTEEFAERILTMAEEIERAPASATAGPVGLHLPGEGMWERRERACRSGLLLRRDVVASLLAAAHEGSMSSPPWLLHPDGALA